MSLQQYSRRAMSQRPGRTTFTILSIVIGVMAVIAVMLITATTRNSYKRMAETVTGHAKLEVRGLANASFLQEVLQTVEVVPGIAAAVPVVNRPSKLFVGDRTVRLSVLGIDPKRDKAVRDYKVVAGRDVEEGDELLLDEEFAAQVGAKLGEELTMATQRSLAPHKVTVVGLARPASGAALRQAALVFMPIGRAQALLNARGKTKFIDSIQIVPQEGFNLTELQQAIAAVLPEGLKVEQPSSNTQLMQQTLQASEQGLWLATAFMLMMGSFIILNTFLMNLGERRRQLAIMRAIGATRGQLTGMLIKEALFLGVIGTAIGVVAGLVGAYLLNDLLAVALEVTLPSIMQVISWKPIVFAAALGMGISLLGVLIPALRAGRVSPLEGMSQVTREDMTGMPKPYIAAGFVCMIVGGCIVYAGLQGMIPIEYPRYGALLWLVGFGAGVVPLMLQPFGWLVSKLLTVVGRVESSLALRQVLRHRVRTTLTVFVLFLAGCAGVALANSLLDNVNDVKEWSAQAIGGDFFLRSMMPDMSSGTAPDLPDELAGELAKLPMIQTLDSVAFIQANVPTKDFHGSMPGGSPESDNLTAIVVARSMNGEGKLAFDLVEGDDDKLRQEMLDGEVVIGTVLAQRMGAKAGDMLPLETVEGVKQLRIAAIANEYMVGGLAIHMQREVAEKLMGLEGVDGYIIKADEANLPALKTELLALADKHGLLLHTKAEIGSQIDSMVSVINGSLWILIILGFVIAAFGVVNTLTMNVLEQTRELGMLRIVAMTTDQVRRTIVIQALIIGAVGILPGIAAGIGAAWIMNLAMMPSFGHPIEFGLHPVLLIASIFGSLIVVLVAAWLPARRAVRINVVEALHYE